MYKKKFYFIVFEGIEGTGKSYQINKLFNNLKKKKINTIKSREPGGSKTAEKIRNLIFSKIGSSFDKITDFYLMLAARNEHFNKTILPAKKNKTVLISDRFTDSTYAYQVIGNKIDNRLNTLNQNYILKGLKPNLTILLKSNFKSIFSRIQKRKKNNKFDKLKIDFYKKAQKAFLSKAKKNKNYCIFDSSNNTPDLEKEIFKLIVKKLK